MTATTLTDNRELISTPLQFAYAMRAKIKRRQPLHILLVEDDDSDIMLTGCALDDTYIPHHLHIVKSGEAMLSYLRHEPPFTDAPSPDLILLDVHLPHMDGIEVLAELAQEASFNRIPIIILSGSQDHRHILTSCNLWLQDYLAKPCNPDKLLEAFGKLHSP